MPVTFTILGDNADTRCHTKNREQQVKNIERADNHAKRSNRDSSNRDSSNRDTSTITMRIGGRRLGGLGSRGHRPSSIEPGIALPPDILGVYTIHLRPKGGHRFEPSAVDSRDTESGGVEEGRLRFARERSSVVRAWPLGPGDDDRRRRRSKVDGTRRSPRAPSLTPRFSSLARETARGRERYKEIKARERKSDRETDTHEPPRHVGTRYAPLSRFMAAARGGGKQAVNMSSLKIGKSDGTVDRCGVRKRARARVRPSVFRFFLRSSHDLREARYKVVSCHLGCFPSSRETERRREEKQTREPPTVARVARVESVSPRRTDFPLDNAISRSPARRVGKPPLIPAANVIVNLERDRKERTRRFFQVPPASDAPYSVSPRVATHDGAPGESTAASRLRHGDGDRRSRMTLMTFDRSLGSRVTSECSPSSHVHFYQRGLTLI
ncbi:hypothetical protein DBV15_03531 [Temnothorax longispinosus]|uniref:Uncharacterized protein n=1 Tax=Temnothorax longispinosus TaxID=300112 RepID=A0A4S2KVI4_9HYME|nr:hypothetical protein DBV15_03531 [Temnothorax longispinosus]